MAAPIAAVDLLLLLLSAAAAAAVSGENVTTIISRTCGSAQTTNTQAFDVSFVNSMGDIFQNITGSGFAMAVSGTTPSDTVYGLGQCYNYLSSRDCGLCYAQSRVTIPLCLPSITARTYLSGCFLRYGDYNFSTEAVDGFDSASCGSTKVVDEAARFREVARALVSNLTAGASAAAGYYLIGNATVTSKVSVYGVAQCWKSLNISGCRGCLEKSRSKILGCLPASDGKALMTGCFVRYSTTAFYLPVISSNNNSAAKRRIRLAIALGVTFVVFVLIEAAIIYARRRFQKEKNNHSGLDRSSEIFKLISESPLSFKIEDLKKATSNFKAENKIGQGGYGTVYKGVLRDGREVAVKRLFFHTSQFVEQFFNEVNLISQVQHKNLVRLLGCSVDGPESLLVYEYIPNKSVDNFLFDPYKKVVLDWGIRVDILVGTAEGLAYLHEGSDVRIIHRDIKAANVLLDEKFKAKIADFGLARYFAEGQSHLSTGIAGTIGYMAPEYIVHGQLTEKVDVYSYGVLVLELLTGKKNSATSPDELRSLASQVWDGFKSESLVEMVDEDIRNECREEEAIKMFKIGLLCTQASPSLRPPMRKVVEMLAGSAKVLPTPAEPPFLEMKGLDLRFGNSYDSSYRFSSSVSSKPSAVSHSRPSINHSSFGVSGGR